MIEIFGIVLTEELIVLLTMVLLEELLPYLPVKGNSFGQLAAGFLASLKNRRSKEALLIDKLSAELSAIKDQLESTKPKVTSDEDRPLTTHSIHINKRTMTKALFVDVPQYYPQTDSRTSHADRMCFSSTVAMAIKFLLPDALKGVNADDDYLQVVLKHGDTTSHVAQQRAISEYGLVSSFTKKGTIQDLRRILSEGRPVPVGFLHHGTPSAPRGGGHWALLVGLDETHATFHDPYGELDNVNGGYVRVGPFGKNIRYSLKNWLPRWTHGGEAWYLDVQKPGNSQPKQLTGPYKGTFESVKAIAEEKGARWPQVVAAQWALESGYGKHTSGKNNFFGIKGTPGTKKGTKEFLNGSWVTITDTFKDYDSAEACIADLIRMWYRDYKSFKGVNRAESVEACCKMLKSEGYATDPSYPGKLLRIIKENS